MAFVAPVDDIAFALEHVAGFERLVAGAFPDLAPDTVGAVLAEAGRFASTVVGPLNRVGDTDPARLEKAFQA